MQTKMMVGRQQEQAVLTSALTTVLDGESAVVLVTGPAGIGKSRLLTDTAEHAIRLGAAVLHGRASELERAVPFSVVVDAFDDFLRTLPPDDLATIPSEDRTELGFVFPTLSGVHRPEAPVPEDRVRAYIAVRQLLSLLARSRPIVLVLDDLHWSDRATVELLAHLVRRPPSGPVLVIASYRPAQADPALTRAVGAAVRAGSAVLLQPQPLTAAETGELLGVTGPERDRLHELSGGNPFLLLELVRCGGFVAGSDGNELPRPLAEAIVADIFPLSGKARSLAEAASAVGDPFDLDLAMSAAAPDLTEDDDPLDALDELAAHDVVRRTELPRRFAWRHPLVRRAVYESLLPGRRLALHQRCAELLAQWGATPAERAVHIEHAARPGDWAAAEVLTSAADEATARAPASAARWLEAALRLLPPETPPERRLSLMGRLPPLLQSLGEPRRARDQLESALALVPASAVSRRVHLMGECARLDQVLGQHDAAHRLLTSALDELPDHTSPEAVGVMVALVMDGFYRRRADEMRMWGRSAVESATACGDRSLLAAAHGACALANALSGSISEAEVHRDAAAALIDEMTDDQLAPRLDAVGQLAGAELYLDRHREAVEHAERGLRIGRARGTTGTAPTLIPTLGTATWIVGRLGDSVRLLDDAVESARASRDEQNLAWLLFNLGYAQLMVGDIGEALQSAEESVALATALEDSVILTWAAAISAGVLVEDGRPQEALRRLHDLCGGPSISGVPGAWRTHMLDVAVRAHLALDDHVSAATAANAAWAVADRVMLPYARSMAGRSSAACAMAVGDLDRAAQLALRSVADGEQISARIDTALTRTLLGETLASAGRTAEAVATLRTAARELDAMGAYRYRDRAERALGRLGRRPHRRTTPGSAASGLASLTEREREVADLVVDRRTNPEIAATLFLSPKTVETHLRNIFRKLDVTSRTEVARVVETQERRDR